METKHVSRLEQTKIYVATYFRLFRNEKRWKSLISTVLITLLISLVTGSEMFSAGSATVNGSFALVCAGIWVGIFNSIRLICRERAILKREHRVGLHMSAYMAAQMIYSLFVCGLEALIVTVLVVARNWENFPLMGVMLPPAVICCREYCRGLSSSLRRNSPPVLPHICWNWKIASVSQAGLTFGITIVQKILHSEAPSSRADSISASGSCSMNCFIR